MDVLKTIQDGVLFTNHDKRSKPLQMVLTDYFLAHHQQASRRAKYDEIGRKLFACFAFQLADFDLQL